MNHHAVPIVIAVLALAPAAFANESRQATSSKAAAALPEIAPYPGGVRVKPRTQFTSSQKKGHEAAVSSAEKMLANARNDGFVTDDAPDRVAAHYDAALAKIGFKRSSDTPTTTGRMLAYMKGTVMVQVQIHTKRSLWETFLADGEKPPAKANYIFVTAMDTSAMFR